VAPSDEGGVERLSVATRPSHHLHRGSVRAPVLPPRGGGAFGSGDRRLPAVDHPLLPVAHPARRPGGPDRAPGDPFPGRVLRDGGGGGRPARRREGHAGPRAHPPLPGPLPSRGDELLLHVLPPLHPEEDLAPRGSRENGFRAEQDVRLHPAARGDPGRHHIGGRPAHASHVSHRVHSQRTAQDPARRDHTDRNARAGGPPDANRRRAVRRPGKVNGRATASSAPESP
jgi:hypothetical protein